MSRRCLAALVLIAPLPLVGCSQNQGGAPAPTPAPSFSATTAQVSPTAGQQVDGGAFFDATRDAVQKAGTFAMKTRMGTGQQAVSMTGTGDVSDPNRPLYDVTVSTPSGRTSQMILLGDTVYLQLPTGQGAGKFVQMPAAALNESGGADLRALMNPAEQLQSVRPAVRSVVHVGTETVDGARLQHYSVTLDPAKVQNGGPTAANSTGGAATIPFDVWVDDQHRLRRMTMDADGTTLTTTVSAYGGPVSIAAPPSASITRIPTGAPSSSPPPAPTDPGATPTG